MRADKFVRVVLSHGHEKAEQLGRELPSQNREKAKLYYLFKTYRVQIRSKIEKPSCICN